MQNKPIKINGKEFKSREVASKYFNVSLTKLANLINKYGAFNKSVCCIPKEAFEDKRTNNRVKTKKESVGCKVKCLEDNFVYPSISSAARACNVSMWTMSVKMQTAGEFKKDNKTYVRLSPMNTKNTYKNTGATLQIIHKKSKENINNIVKVENSVPDNKVSTLDSSMDIARNVLKKELINRINQNKWSEASALLEVVIKLQ